MDRSRQIKSIHFSDFSIPNNRLVVIAGPCAAESLDLCRTVAEVALRECASRNLPYIFKASFDKANRSSGGTSRGPGIHEGLEILAKIKAEFQVPITTDIHLPDQAAIVAEVADLLQIPAFLCRQSDLLEACAKTSKPVNVKKGQFLSPQDAKNIVSKLEEFGATGAMLTERGTTFGYNTLIVDMPGLEIMRSHGVPVCFDATHSAQRPGGMGQSSGGVRESIPAMVRAACAVGIDALFVETHPDPKSALSDKETQWQLDQFGVLLSQAVTFRNEI